MFFDRQGLLAEGPEHSPNDTDELDDDALLAELGVTAEAEGISELKHVRSTAEKRAAEEIANRETCEDFDTFKPLFRRVKKEPGFAPKVRQVLHKAVQDYIHAPTETLFRIET